MRQRVSADTDLEIIPPDWDELEAIAKSIPPRRRTPSPVFWTIAAIAAAGLLAAGAVGSRLYDNRKPPSAVPTTAPTPRGPPATADAPNSFTAHLEPLSGLVAVASDGHLRVLDGDNQVMRDVYRPAAVSRPMWSPSGRWLAYVMSDTQLWVMRRDETDAQQVGLVSVARADTVAWSPKTDTLAMITSAGLLLTPPEGALPQPLPHTAGASSVSWSPDGKRIAYAMPDGGGMDLVVLDESGGGVQRIHTLPVADEDLRLAGWWPDGRGVLAWKVPRSASLAADSDALVSISLAGAEVPLTTMLPYPQWLSWSPDGRHVAVVEGEGRTATTGKHLAVCDVVAGTCQSIAAAPGTLALDPAWSPDGTRIAYVQADDDPNAGYGDWVTTRQLWTMRSDGSDAKRLGALDGVDAPRWFADGKRLLSVGGENALWLVDPTFVGPLASRLYDGEFPPGYYYGFVDWSQTLAWHP